MFVLAIKDLVSEAFQALLKVIDKWRFLTHKYNDGLVWTASEKCL